MPSDTLPPLENGVPSAPPDSHQSPDFPLLDQPMNKDMTEPPLPEASMHEASTSPAAPAAAAAATALGLPSANAAPEHKAEHLEGEQRIHPNVLASPRDPVVDLSAAGGFDPSAPDLDAAESAGSGTSSALQAPASAAWHSSLPPGWPAQAQQLPQQLPLHEPLPRMHTGVAP